MTGNPPANLNMIGGEMLSWSEPSPATGGAALAELVGTLVRPGSTVLLAGPHTPDVPAALAGAHVTVLVRGIADANAFAAAFPDARVLCGSVVKLPEETFDVVLASDGLDRLATVEGAQPTWGETLDRLVRAVAPGGHLVVAAENPLGVHRLVDFGKADDPEANTAWAPVGSADESRPTSVAQLRRAVSSRGFAFERVYAGYPTPAAPTVLATEDLLAEVPQGVLAAACREIAGPVLGDPRRIAAEAVRAGIAGTLAPVWLTVATRGDAATVLPEGVLADVGVAPGLRVSVGLSHEAGGGLRRRVLRHSGTEELAADAVRRDVGALAGPLPAGRLLSEVLLGHVLRRDIPALRRVLPAYASWLAEQGERAVFARVDQVVVDGDEYASLDPSWRWTATVAPDLALAVALRDFAVMLITDGYPHPWPANVDADGLAVILGALAGHEIARPRLTQAVALTAEVARVTGGLTAVQTTELRESIATAGTGSVSLTVDAHRELHRAAEAGRAEVVRLRAVLQRTEDWLADCERKLKETQRSLATLKSTRTYQFSLQLARPVRKVKRLLRRG